MIQSKLVASSLKSSSRLKANRSTEKASASARKASPQQKSPKTVLDPGATKSTAPGNTAAEQLAAPVATAKPPVVDLVTPQSSWSSEGAAASVPVQAVSSASDLDSPLLPQHPASVQRPAKSQRKEGQTTACSLPHQAPSPAKSQRIDSQAAAPSPPDEAPASAKSQRIDEQAAATSRPDQPLASVSTAAACTTAAQPVKSQIRDPVSQQGSGDYSFREGSPGPSERRSMPEASSSRWSSILAQNRRQAERERSEYSASSKLAVLAGCVACLLPEVIDHTRHACCLLFRISM